ncbi:hypothetical protein EVAR_76154_1 [Eumeta japonica]|uniref:Uncharacterized protein n=1 Tax=Eumeta variegata TaxID=151549 RepID=A0A4C1UVU2_EUMVA|nr:hypothetical protein EVAR_76154_1 [Eumeta japonica]
MEVREEQGVGPLIGRANSRSAYTNKRSHSVCSAVIQLDVHIILPSNLTYLPASLDPDPIQYKVKIISSATKKAVNSIPTGVKPVAPPKAKPPPPVYLRDKIKYMAYPRRAPKFIKHTRRTDKRRSIRKTPSINYIQNFPTLGVKTKETPSAGEFRPAPAPIGNAWFWNQPPRATPKPNKGSSRPKPSGLA